MPHPRRSRQFRSARARTFRAKDVNLPRLHYVAEGRTLLLVQTRAILDLEREERVERAAAMVRHLEGQVECKRQDLAGQRHDRSAHRRITRWLTEDKAALADALWELKQARRSLARPATIPVTLAVVNLPEPRCRPNALPGGTSRRRATRIEWAIKYAQWDDAAEDAWFIQRYAG